MKAVKKEWAMKEKEPHFVSDSETEDDRPWERPGALRRDCEPHRGEFLLLLGRFSLALGCVSVCIPALSLMAILVGVVVLVLARRDLRSMGAGKMDPAGKSALLRAKGHGRLGILLGLICPIAVLATIPICYFLGWLLS